MTTNAVAIFPQNGLKQPLLQTPCHLFDAQPSKSQRRIGWALSGLIGLFLIGGSGVPKFLDWPGKAAMLNHLGIATTLLPKIGVLEISVAVLFLIPRTSFIGAVLVTGYLGGAVMTHVRIGDPPFNILFPVIIGSIVWIGMALRKPVVFSLAGGKASDERR